MESPGGEHISVKLLTLAVIIARYRNCTWILFSYCSRRETQILIKNFKKKTLAFISLLSGSIVVLSVSGQKLASVISVRYAMHRVKGNTRKGNASKGNASNPPR